MVGFPPPGFPMDFWVCSQDPNIPRLPWELRASSLGPFLAVVLGRRGGGGGGGECERIRYFLETRNP